MLRRFAGEVRSEFQTLPRIRQGRRGGIHDVASRGWSAGTQATVGSGVYRAKYAALEPGTVLGNRSEVIQLLGEGGTGAVYKVRDREVDRFVALRMIRPELAVRP